MKTWIAVLALAVPGAALAAGDRIVVMAPAGATGIRAQLTETLCLSEDCVAPEQVLSAGKLDMGKVGRQHVTAVVTGHAIPSKKGPEVELQVIAPSGKAKMSEKLPLNETNKLAVKDLVTASAQLLSSIDGSEMAREDAGDGTQVATSAAKKHASKGSRVAHASHVRAHRIASRTHAPGARG